MVKEAVPTLILASTSPYRRELLGRLGVEFETFAPEVDESLRANETPGDAGLRLACAKARAAAGQRADALILAGDQLASFNGQPVGKPADTGTAEQYLEQFSGRILTYYTAIALLISGNDTPVTHLDESRVHLRPLDRDEIRRYVAKENPIDCAGGLKLESLGSALCERIETEDPTALAGLPLIATARLLREHGYALP
ncbi:MAG: Maf family nucleotide pyrophosphatase [Gammaproteobacteria bacterium]|nr:Maf family nucleotide pyrophosphatase [Gammaproteobacteria bacterium]